MLFCSECITRVAKYVNWQCDCNAAPIVLCKSVNSKGSSAKCRRTVLYIILVQGSCSKLLILPTHKLFAYLEFDDEFDNDEVDASYNSTAFDESGKLECAI